MRRRKAPWWVWLIFVIVGVIGLLYTMELVNRKSIQSGAKLPNNATDIINVGDGWYEFTYKEQRFLFYERGIADCTRAAIVKIDKSEIKKCECE
jgi:hypothetical protein